MFTACTGARYQFSENDYAAREGDDRAVRVTVHQISASLVDIRLKLTPYTYAQYTQRANQPGSTLAPSEKFRGRPLDEFHESRPDPAESKYECFYTRIPINNSDVKTSLPLDNNTQHACIYNSDGTFLFP